MIRYLKEGHVYDLYRQLTFKIDRATIQVFVLF